MNFSKATWPTLGMLSEPVKLEAVRNWPIPKNVKEVRQFLGFTVSYRWIVKGFAAKAPPRNNILVGPEIKPKAVRAKQKKNALFE